MARTTIKQARSHRQDSASGLRITKLKTRSPNRSLVALDPLQHLSSHHSHRQASRSAQRLHLSLARRMRLELAAAFHLALRMPIMQARNPSQAVAYLAHLLRRSHQRRSALLEQLVTMLRPAHSRTSLPFLSVRSAPTQTILLRRNLQLQPALVRLLRRLVAVVFSVPSRRHPPGQVLVSASRMPLHSSCLLYTSDAADE